MPLNPEQMFQKPQNREWLNFLGVLHANKTEVPKSPVATQAMEHFIREYKVEMESTAPGEQIEILEKIYLFHVGKIYKFPEEIIHKIVDLTLSFYRAAKPKNAYNLAKQWKERPLSREINGETFYTFDEQIFD